jgi:hypothetical protein
MLAMVRFEVAFRKARHKIVLRLRFEVDEVAFGGAEYAG